MEVYGLRLSWPHGTRNQFRCGEQNCFYRVSIQETSRWLPQILARAFGDTPLRTCGQPRPGLRRLLMRKRRDIAFYRKDMPGDWWVLSAVNLGSYLLSYLCGGG